MSEAEQQAPDAAAPLRRVLKIAAIVVWTLIWFVPVWIPYLLKLERIRARLVSGYYHGIGQILGLHVRIHGMPDKRRPLLVVSNHVSYLDILALGGTVPVAFTPKSEIAGWPIIGYFCKMAGCVFIDRRPRTVGQHRKALENALRWGSQMVLFPEGTTGLGTALLHFHSAFFSMVEWVRTDLGVELPIQPVCIAYHALDGMPLTTATREQVAWIGEADFGPHIMALFGHRSIDVSITFLPSFDAGPADRKMLASRCETEIGTALQGALAGDKLPAH